MLLRPGDVTWIDVVVPHEHARWTDDISTSAYWLGEVWCRALASLGASDLTVHRGAMVRTPWSGHVCFAGIGGGEVMQGAAKAVGVSQRRTRAAARFQCAVYHRWDAALHAALFRAPGPSVVDLTGITAEIDATPGDVRDAFVQAI